MATNLGGDKKIERLLTLFQVANQDFATYSQVADLVKVLVDVIKKNRAELEFTISRSEVNKAIKYLNQSESRLSKLFAENEKKNRIATSTQIDNEIRKIVEMIPASFDPSYLQEQIDAINEEEPTKIEAEEVRDLLETLKDEDRLDASAIKNLPEFVEKANRVISSSHALWNLMDVNISGITAGQHLEWNGTQWIAVTPAGSTGTPVWGEDLTSQGPGTVYTLAHTPVLGTVRVFKGGAYQQAGAGGDYTLSGDTITFNTATQASEVVLADYSY